MENWLISKIDKIIGKKLKDIEYTKVEEYKDKLIYLFPNNKNITIELTKYNNGLGIAYLNFIVHSRDELIYQNPYTYYLDKEDIKLGNTFKRLLEEYNK